LNYTTWVSAMEADRRAREQKPHDLLWRKLSVSSQLMWLLNGRPVLMRQRTMLDLGDKRGVSLKHMKVFGCPHIQSSVQRAHIYTLIVHIKSRSLLNRLM
jgi:hypothetical protein